jgi:hypothetical protein
MLFHSYEGGMSENVIRVSECYSISFAFADIPLLLRSESNKTLEERLDPITGTESSKNATKSLNPTLGVNKYTAICRTRQ